MEEAVDHASCWRRAAVRTNRLNRALPGAEPLRPAYRAGHRARSRLVTTGQGQASSLNDVPRHRRRLYGRLAAMFFAGSGVLGLVTLPLPAPGLDEGATAAVSAAALALGAAVWLAPWESWPERASLAIVPPAFALIGLANTFGGTSLQAYGVFFVVAFVWIGLAHPPGTSAAMAPLAAAAYLLPMFSEAGNVSAGLYSAAITIPVCVLVGEGIAWGAGRLDRIERALRLEQDRTERLRELDEMKNAFLSAASHELRTPITICRGHLEVLEDGAGPGEVRAVKETVIDELSRMGRLVEDLTNVAQADDQALLRVESLALDSFVSSIMTKAEPILGDRLRVDADIGGATFLADRQRVTQALLNLLRNAAQHAPGERPVWLRVRAGPDSWRFEVADEGGGLRPGDERVVFEPFSTGTSPTSGTGIGLSIVRGIARAHGGDCGVINRPGRGATFWIRLPR
jgi:signal transduction histidine kinase